MRRKMITAALALGIMATGFSSQADAHELTYKVQSGDTLWKISYNNKLTVQELMQYNNLTSSTIYVGQELSLLAPHTHEAVVQTYTVKSGDTLWKIATANGLTVTQLKSFNNLTSDMIYVGQVLKLSANTTTVPAPEVKPAFNADALIAEGKRYIGVPYVWGGNTPSGFDCSGFLKYVYNTQGVTLPRTVATIWDATTPVAAPQKGDIVFFTTYEAGPSHAGIYIGDNKFLHASTSVGVTISDLNNSYWNPRYLGARAVK
jgi:peptidoglycan DL-endopeptidase LytE